MKRSNRIKKFKISPIVIHQHGKVSSIAIQHALKKGNKNGYVYHCHFLRDCSFDLFNKYQDNINNYMQENKR